MRRLINLVALLLSFICVIQNQAAPLKESVRTKSGRNILPWKPKTPQVKTDRHFTKHLSAATKRNRKPYRKAGSRSMVKPEMLQSNHRSSFQDYPWIYEEPAPIPCGVQYGRVLGDDCIQVITDNSRMCNCNGGGYEYPGCCCGKLPLVYPDITCPCCGGPINAEGGAVVAPAPPTAPVPALPTSTTPSSEVPVAVIP